MRGGGGQDIYLIEDIICSKVFGSCSITKSTVTLSAIDVFRASPLERIAMIWHGVPAAEAKRLLAKATFGQSAGFKALNLSAATVNKKARQGAILSREESERVIGFARLVGQLEAIVQKSGDATGFDAGTFGLALHKVPADDLIPVMQPRLAE